MSASVVPARAGMSPMPTHPGTGTQCGPRARGDEPWTPLQYNEMWVWSPRERG